MAVETHATRLDARQTRSTCSGRYDLVADGSDNFATRYLVSDACYFAKRPLVTAAVGTFDGTLTTIRAHEKSADGTPNPTYRCLFPEPPPPGTVPACAEAGILGALAGVLGSLMALEVIREIVGFGEGLVGRLLMVDARSMRFETLRYGWDPENPLSGEQPDHPRSVGARLTRRYFDATPRSGRELGAGNDRPFVLAVGADLEAIGLAALPGAAEAVLGQLPGAFALGAGLGDRLARHLPVRPRTPS